MSSPPFGHRDFLFVQSTTEFGGAERALLNLFTASEQLRRRSMIVTLGFGQGDLPARLRSAGAAVVELKMPRLRQVGKLVPSFGRLVQLTRDAGVRAVIGNGSHPQVVGGMVARLAGAKAVFLAHGVFATPLWKNSALEALSVSAPCDLILAVSEPARAAVAALRPRVPNRLLHNGTPIPVVSLDAARTARAELGAGEGDLLIGVFARLQRQKGQDTFVEAARRVAERFPQARFAVVGGAAIGFEAGYVNELKKAAAVPALSGKIAFTGFRTDVARLMAGCDVVCHTSRPPESFGLVIVEAMALRRPVIATAGEGPREIIAAPTQGVLIPPDDPAALARALSDLIVDPARRRSLGEEGYRRVVQDFSIDVAASKLVQHLDDVIAPPAGGA